MQSSGNFLVTQRPKELIVVSPVSPIDQDLEDRARTLATADGVEFENNLCLTNSWFAAQAAVNRGDKEVLLGAGFRERGGKPWNEDPHCWISLAGRHFEPSPGNDPSGAVYLQLWTLELNDATKARVFAEADELVNELIKWAEKRVPVRWGSPCRTR